MNTSLADRSPRSLAPPLAAVRASASRLLGLARENRFVVGLTAVTALAYSTYSVLQHVHYGTSGYDLALFDQAIWHYSRFQAPASSVGGFTNLLGDHFHPLLVVLAPLYWVWSDPRVLLIAQGVLVAASIIPVYAFARSRVEPLAAQLIAVAYALYWGLHSGVAFDFHEVAFAPLLVALVLLYADRRQWTHYGVSLALLLLVKEDLAVFAVFLGLVLLLRRHWRVGLGTVVAGGAWYLLATNVFIPYFAGGHPYSHWTYDKLGPDLPQAIANIVRSPELLVGALFDSPEKTETVLLIIVPFLGLVVYSQLGLLLVPLLAERMLSSVSNLWQADFHYSLAIAPVVAMASADGINNALRAFQVARAKRVAVALAAVMVAINLVVASQYPLRNLLDPGFYSKTPRDHVDDAALRAVPASASVAAQNMYLPHLAHRDDVYTFAPTAPQTQYIVIDVRDRDRQYFPNESFDAMLRVLAKRRPAYRTVFSRDGIEVLARR